MIARRGVLLAGVGGGAARAQTGAHTGSQTGAPAGAPAGAGAAWPARAITLVSPLAAGGSVDIIARLVAEGWSARFGQPVVVENRPAANGTLALEQVARAAPDGYTAVVTGQTFVAFNPVLYPNLRYDPLRDFAYVTQVAAVSNALVVRAASPVRDLAGLLAAARAAPGRLTYSSGGVGTTHHVSAALLLQLSGLEATHVAYRGAPQGILAVTAGEVDFAFYNISTVQAAIRAGTLRALAVSSAERSAFLPDVATVRELGVAGFALTTWLGLATVAGTAPAIVARLFEATRDLLAQPATQARLAALGFEPVETTAPADMPALIRAEQARWGPVLRATGARLE